MRDGSSGIIARFAEHCEAHGSQFTRLRNGQKTGTLGEVQGVGPVVTYERDLPNELYDPARMHSEGERCPRCR